MSNTTTKDPIGQPVNTLGTPVAVGGELAVTGMVNALRGRSDPTYDARKMAIDAAFYDSIKKGTEAIGFNPFNAWMNGITSSAEWAKLPFYGLSAYDKVKAASEAFLLSRVVPCRTSEEFKKAYEGALSSIVDPDARAKAAAQFVDSWNAATPLHKLLLQKLVEFNTSTPGAELFHTLVPGRLHCPLLIELIWSYWHEESMLVQTVSAVAMRFQNRKVAGREGINRLELEPLRPLANLLWGYVQDEHNRLTVPRRAHEYDHQYGMRLIGKAVPDLDGADPRSKFLQAFHFLLNSCVQLFKQEDDLNVQPNGYAVLNALKEVQMILGEGMHNQFGDLPWTARTQMLVQMWLLAQPEMQRFLGGRPMAPYPEPWMDRVESMKQLMGWQSASVLHFHELAVTGERILLSIRHGQWVGETDGERARAWARTFREAITTYLHGYRAVTGVDLSGDHVDFTPPSVHLRNRLSAGATA